MAPDRLDGHRLRPAEQLLTAHVSRRFYLDRRTKVEIAEELGLSRFKVARLLEDAVASGIVRIEVRSPAHLDAELSLALAGELGLVSAVVVETGDEDADALHTQVGRVAADLLTEVLEPGEVLGIAMGRALAAMTTAVEVLPPCTVVQLCGALVSMRASPSPVELVGRVARASGGPFFAMHAPLVVSDAGTASALLREPEVAAAMHRFGDVTTAVVAVGAWSPGNSTVFDTLGTGEQQRLADDGACAEACGILLDPDGHPLEGLADRVVGIRSDQLALVPRVIALMYGAAKAPAARAMARSGLIDHLVVDSGLARATLCLPA